MQVVKNPGTDIYANFIYAMRRSGATLQQIADRLNRTKERVRQILVKNYGSTRHELLSTEQLRKRLGLSRPRVMELCRDKIITPAREWNTKGTYRFLWSPDAVEQVNNYFSTNVLCKRCHRPLPSGRRVFCSVECYNEGHKYKYKSALGKKRHLESVKRYRQKGRVLVQAAATGR